MKRASAPFMVVALVVMALAGFRLTRHDEAAANVAARPTCAAGRQIARADFVAAFPIAHALRVRQHYVRRGALVTQGYALGSLRAVRVFYASKLPAAGFRLGAGDAEQYEAETDFVGHGVRGHLKLNTYPSCRGAVLVSVVTRAR
jgi:hypothetical protein